MAALDILGSFFVGGILLIIVLNLNADLMDRSFSGNLEAYNSAKRGFDRRASGL